MASQTRLISGGVNYYLAGVGTPYVGLGSPWTAQATTPFRLSMNDTTGPTFTPAPAPTIPITGGGPPFRIGRSLITKSYDNVTETFGLQIKAGDGQGHTALDNALNVLRILRQILSTSAFESPCILVVQPDTATTPVYFEILHADIAEKPDYLWETTGTSATLRLNVTWTRTMGVLSATVATISAQTMQNRSSGSPNDVRSLGGGAGELTYEGQPLNLRIVPSATANRMYLATVYERINTSVANSQTTTTSISFSSAAATITNARNRAGIKLRILARFDTFTAPSKIRLQATVRDSNGVAVIKTLPTFALPHASATSTLLDFGWVDPHTFRSVLGSGLGILVTFTLSSSDGTSVAARLDYVETLLYYTFATIDNANASSTVSLITEQTNNYNVNGVIVPNTVPRAYAFGASDWAGERTYRGQLPRHFNGSSLYVAWLGTGAVGTNGVHDTSHTATVTADYMPMFHTLTL